MNKPYTKEQKRRRSRTPKRNRMIVCYSTYFDLDFEDNIEDDYEQESNPQSQFGTRQYWDDTYIGRGDFPMEEYSWYYGWDDAIQKIWNNNVVPHLEKDHAKQTQILIPGIGNDSTILDLYGSGWKHITAFDYSQYAIDRQYDLLYSPALQKEIKNRNIQLYRMDATDLKEDIIVHKSIAEDNVDDIDGMNKNGGINWTEHFGIVFEKGALDAIYLSSSEDVERVTKAVSELTRVLKTNGIFVSVSGVIPEELRRELFPLEQWEWIRDGSDDLKAGCFVWKKR